MTIFQKIKFYDNTTNELQQHNHKKKSKRKISIKEKNNNLGAIYNKPKIKVFIKQEKHKKNSIPLIKKNNDLIYLKNRRENIFYNLCRITFCFILVFTFFIIIMN